jgi:hypothetical protein
MKTRNPSTSKTRADQVAGTIPGRARIVLSGTKARSRITNGSELLPEIDGRSVWARRCRDLIALHVSDMGGEDHLSEAQRSIIRRAAVLTIELEQMEMRFAAGEASPRSLDTYQRLTNTLRRVLQTLGIERRAKDVTPSLEQYIAGKRGHYLDEERE